MKQFLILKPTSLGDILHAFPAVSALLRANPGARADWLIHPAFRDITAYLPGIRNNILFERKKLGRISEFPSAFAALWKQLRTTRYDAVIDLQGLARSAFIGRCASGIHAGPRHPREPIAMVCYSRFLHAPGGVHAVERNNAMIADFLGRNDLDFSYSMPVVERFAEPVRKMLKEKVPPGKTLVAVAPGARWITKQWPPEFFADVMVRLDRMRSNLHFLLVGSKDEKVLSEKIRTAAQGVSCTDLCGETSVGELVEVIRQTSLFLCNDSGPMHIAAALRVPVLAMFGPTSPVLTGPYSEKKYVLQPSLPCILCLRRYCKESLCHGSIDPCTAAARADELLYNEPRNRELKS